MILAKERSDYTRQESLWVEKPKKSRKVRRVKNKVKLFYASIVLVAFAMFLLLTTKYAQIAATGYEIVDMKKQIKTMENNNQALEMKIDQLQSLGRIESVATQKLGMVKPDMTAGDQFVAVETKGTALNNDVAAETKVAANTKTTAENPKQKSVPVIEALTKLLANWTGKVAQAEAKTASE